MRVTHQNTEGEECGFDVFTLTIKRARGRSAKPCSQPQRPSGDRSEPVRAPASRRYRGVQAKHQVPGRSACRRSAGMRPNSHRFLEGGLGKRLRAYFLKGFYDDHVKRYKKRPIYWLITSAKGTLQALIYLHRYNRDTVNRFRAATCGRTSRSWRPSG